jgi:hypothetical protein
MTQRQAAESQRNFDDKLPAPLICESLFVIIESDASREGGEGLVWNNFNSFVCTMKRAAQHVSNIDLGSF